MSAHPFDRLWVSLDTETTGLPKHPTARVIELAAVLVGPGGEEVSSFSTLVYPGEIEENPEAAGVHGIDMGLVNAHAPGPADVTAAFWMWWHGVAGQAPVCAWNIDFDREMVRRTLPGLVLPWTQCLMRAVMPHMGHHGALEKRGRDWKFASLAKAAAFYGVTPAEPAHRALADARTAAAVITAWRGRVIAERGLATQGSDEPDSASSEGGEAA